MDDFPQMSGVDLSRFRRPLNFHVRVEMDVSFCRVRYTQCNEANPCIAALLKCLQLLIPICLKERATLLRKKTLKSQPLSELIDSYISEQVFGNETLPRVRVTCTRYIGARADFFSIEKSKSSYC